jgi:hypothetical protein
VAVGNASVTAGEVNVVVVAAVAAAAIEILELHTSPAFVVTSTG